MRARNTRVLSTGLGLFIILFSLNSCYKLSELHLREYLRPIKVFLNKERTYWTDKIEYRGSTGTEIVYYKNGRPALERLFDENGFLRTITYLGRDGAPMRMDSLVYAGEELIGAYYFTEPEHKLVMRFLNYQQQGQLSQRSWFEDKSQLLSREFFLFDRHGSRRMRMIFDGNDSLLYSELFKSGTDALELKNTYSVSGDLVSQVRYEPNQPTYQYDFDTHGVVKRLSQLYDDGNLFWSSDLIYNRDGTLARSNFSVNNRFLFSHLGDIELVQQSLRSWKHPASPSQIEKIIRYNHRDPFVSESHLESSGLTQIEYRLPRSGAVFRRNLVNSDGQTVSDTLYTGRGDLQPVSVRNFGDDALIDNEVTYDLEGREKWLHTWYRDDNKRVIREELTALPDTFSAAITRFYDALGQPAFTERFAAPDSFEGTWVFYHGGGVKKTLFYNHLSELTESWLTRPGGDTTRHSLFNSIDYFRIESKYGMDDTLKSQLRFTNDGILCWELFFDSEGKLIREVNRKKDGSVYKEVTYDHETRGIQSSTFAPLNPNTPYTGEERKGDLISQVVTRLNAEGHTVQVKSVDSNGEVVWEKRHAYRDGKLLKSAQLDPAGKPIIISSYTHNEQGQVLTETAINKAGEVVHTVENRYDELDQLIWKSFSSEMTATNSSNRYYYDEQGLMFRNEIIEGTRFIEAVEYQYYPEYYLRLATHYTTDGEILRKELENYFGAGVFAEKNNEED